MRITSYNPFFNLRDFGDDVLSVFSDKKDIFKPSVNIKEDENAYYIQADLPGIKKDDISIEINEDVLTISGERKYKNEEKGENFHKTESFFGKFERSFSLSKDIDVNKISAEQKDGVLEILLPKIEIKKEESKKISIK